MIPSGQFQIILGTLAEDLALFLAGQNLAFLIASVALPDPGFIFTRSTKKA